MIIQKIGIVGLQFYLYVMKPHLLLDSITDVSATAEHAIVVSGSHGGLYPAVLASRAGIRAVIFNDAGIGCNRAGIAGVEALAMVGMAAATVDCHSAEIGSAMDMVQNGQISFATEIAESLGLKVGTHVDRAIALLQYAPEPSGILPKMDEARTEQKLVGADTNVLLVDSASLVSPVDDGRIIVAGSHGALIGGDPKRALKAHARFACFNDAGIGKNRIGMSRLPALEQQGIAAATVSHQSCVIGDAASAYKTGVIGAANGIAQAMGVAAGQTLRDALSLVAAIR